MATEGALGDDIVAPTGPWMHHLCIQGCWLLLQGGCEDSTCGDLDRKSVGKLVEAPKCMTMGPSIHRDLILALDQTDLNGGFSLAEEVLPWITDMAGP